ncbi:AAA family ATPase, partial [Acinetobacter baumannii]
MILELPIPPKSQREHIIRQACGDMLSPKNIIRLAESEVLSPAVVNRAAGVIRLVQNQLDNSTATQSLEFLINNTLQAQRHPVIPQSG